MVGSLATSTAMEVKVPEETDHQEYIPRIVIVGDMMVVVIYNPPPTIERPVKIMINAIR